MGRTVQIGYIGLGRRGTSVLRRCLSLMKDVRIKTVCEDPDLPIFP